MTNNWNSIGSIVTLLLSFTFCNSQIDWLRKPTNSVTIRQSGGGLCTNQLVGSFVEHSEDCRLFYLCMERGDAVLASCPSTMLFNAENKICDAPENVRCTNSTNSSAGTNNPPPPTDNNLNNMVTDAASYCATLRQQPENDRIVYIGSSASCNNYYICYYGQAILQTCSIELHWNAVTAKCDLPERAQCTLDVPQSSQPSVDVSNQLIHCPAYGQHLYPHMRRCEFFIYCVKGYATLQQCPFYYYFDVVTKSCQWSRTAVCVRDLNFPRH